MGKISVGRVVMGGVLAGVFLFLTEFLMQGVWLGSAWTEAQKALGKGTSASGMSTTMMIYALWSLVLGIGTVWIYAGIRPRFGPGPGTALRAGLVAWAIGSVGPVLVQVAAGIWPTQLLLTSMGGEFVLFTVAAVMGAAPYKETA